VAEQKILLQQEQSTRTYWKYSEHFECRRTRNRPGQRQIWFKI